MQILRKSYFLKIINSFLVNPICALLGPRQSGKTTLAKYFASQSQEKFTFFDLEDPTDILAMQEPKLLLENLDGNIVIDEIQRAPNLFPYLRTLVDKKPKLKILILGSASKELIRQSSESLAGRISYLEITPFKLEEIDSLQKLLLRGGFPKAYLAANDELCFSWLNNYTKTFLEQDINSLGIKLSPQMLRKFWMILTDYHGNIFNGSEIGRALEIDHKTVKHYLDILTGTFMIRSISPWFENISKRQIKSDKIYFRDAGILNYLLGIKSQTDLLVSRKIGSIWEGFALEQISQIHDTDQNQCFFWGTQSGAEVDLLIIEGTKKIAFEFKYTSQPKITKSMLSAINSLNLDLLTVIIPGDANFFLHEKIQVLGLNIYAKSVYNLKKN